MYTPGQPPSCDTVWVPFLFPPRCHIFLRLFHQATIFWKHFRAPDPWHFCVSQALDQTRCPCPPGGVSPLTYILLHLQRNQCLHHLTSPPPPLIPFCSLGPYGASSPTSYLMIPPLALSSSPMLTLVMHILINAYMHLMIHPDNNMLLSSIVPPPHPANTKPLTGFHISLLMGFIESEQLFYSASETIADLVDK